MLTSVADWATEEISADRFKRVQVLAVSGDYRNCAPDLLGRSLAAYVGIPPDNVFAGPNHLMIVAPLGTFAEPADYRARVDEGVSEAERTTLEMVEVAPDAARIAADNIASLAADGEMSTDLILRAAMVSADAVCAFNDGESLPTADLIRISSVLGVPFRSLLSPTRVERENDPD